MSERFTGKVAVVTGASRGIGFSIAQRLVREGARVCVTARKPDALDEAVAQLGGAEHALAVPGKADDPEHQTETLERTRETFGRLDMLVNNAGINPVYGPIVEIDLSAARKIFEVNALAALSWVQQAYRMAMAEHGGSIVNISSLAGLRPAPGIGFYGVTKAMLAHLTAELAAELAPAIRVNAVAPAIVKTEFARALYADGEAEAASAYPLQRLGVPDDICGAVSFLLSDDAAWLTGQTLPVDGGLSLTGGV